MIGNIINSLAKGGKEAFISFGLIN